jgi:hypothetical protein
MNGVRDGLVGFFLFFAHWLSPQTEKASIAIDFHDYRTPEAVIFKCKLDIAWNKQLEELVDAGIPLQYRILHFSDKSDTVYFYRTLNFDMVHYTYNFTDSTEKATRRSKDYSLIDLALRDYCRWEIEVPNDAGACKVDVTIMPSKAEQLNKMVDMSRVWGQQKVSIGFDPSTVIPERRSRQKEE